MDIRGHNGQAWDREVERGNRWTVPIGPEVIEAPRGGEWEIWWTDHKPVPKTWFPEVRGADLLCLASGGEQQAPILAAAGSNVTVLNNSPRQLAQDRSVADRESLTLETVEGDMRDLSAFADGSFDLVFHPCSNLFVPDVRPVWREAFRVLRRGGTLMAGFVNPILYLFDYELHERGTLEVRHKLPYSDLDSLTEEERARRISSGDPLEFSHTLTEQIGGHIEAGFHIN